MISDTLSDAIARIKQYQRDCPETYQGIAEEIGVTITLMDCLRLCLDMAPDQEQELESLREQLHQAIKGTDVSQVETVRDRLLVRVTTIRERPA